MSDQFQHMMVLTSIIIGLGITNVLLGVSGAIERYTKGNRPMQLSWAPRKDHRGVDLISNVLPFGRLWYNTSDHAIGYAMHYSRSHDALIRFYERLADVIETHEHKGDFKQW